MKQSTARKLYRTGAVVLIAAIAASGTFAWRDLSQKKVNEFAGGNNPDVVLVEPTGIEPAAGKCTSAFLSR